MHSSTTRRRTADPAGHGTRYAELRRELEAELEELAPGGWRAGEETLRGLHSHARRRAHQVLGILSRMDSEAFGRCIDCRLPIAYERLSVLPETRLCARCSWSRERPG